MAPRQSGFWIGSLNKRLTDMATSVILRFFLGFGERIMKRDGKKSRGDFFSSKWWDKTQIVARHYNVSTTPLLCLGIDADAQTKRVQALLIAIFLRGNGRATPGDIAVFFSTSLGSATAACNRIRDRLSKEPDFRSELLMLAGIIARERPPKDAKVKSTAHTPTAKSRDRKPKKIRRSLLIRQAVCKHFGVSTTAVVSKNGNARVMRARSVLWVLLVEGGQLSEKAVKRSMHVSTLNRNAYAIAKRRIAEDAELATELEKIRSSLNLTSIDC